jgi:hypothetical protein
MKTILRLFGFCGLLLVPLASEGSPILYSVTGTVRASGADNVTPLWGRMTIESQPEVAASDDHLAFRIKYQIATFALVSDSSVFFGDEGMFIGDTHGGWWELVGSVLYDGSVLTNQKMVDEGCGFLDEGGAYVPWTYENGLHLWPGIWLASGSRSDIPGFSGLVSFEANVVPEPATLLLLVTGLAGAVPAVRKRRA